LGRRVSKTSNNTVTVFVHSDYQILDEFVSINNSPLTINNSFVYASYIDDPIASINTNGKFFYHSNQQFSIGAITDSLGNLTERFGYNAYGKPITILDSVLVKNEYFFTGRQFDAESGLFYFRARFYDASLGQFISRDPIGYIDGMNLYRGCFVPCDLDPSGFEAKVDVLPGATQKEKDMARVTRNTIVNSDSKADPCYVFFFFGHTNSSNEDYKRMKDKGAENIGVLACKLGKCNGLQNWPVPGVNETIGVGGTTNSNGARTYYPLKDQTAAEAVYSNRLIQLIDSALKSVNDQAKALADKGTKCDCPNYYVQIICTGEDAKTQIDILNWYNREKGTSLSCGGIVSTYKNKNYDLNDPSCCKNTKK
jgi:RHS repeat-associated protein